MKISDDRENFNTQQPECSDRPSRSENYKPKKPFILDRDASVCKINDLLEYPNLFLRLALTAAQGNNASYQRKLLAVVTEWHLFRITLAHSAPFEDPSSRSQNKLKFALETVELTHHLARDVEPFPLSNPADSWNQQTGADKFCLIPWPVTAPDGREVAEFLCSDDSEWNCWRPSTWEPRAAPLVDIITQRSADVTEQMPTLDQKLSAMPGPP